MSFTRIRPSAHAANSTWTSSESTQLDIDHANALDKTGDTVTGSVVVQHGAKIWCKGSHIDIDTDGVFSSYISIINGDLRLQSPNANILCTSSSVIQVINGGGILIQDSGGAAANVLFNTGGNAAFASGATCTFASGSATTFQTGSTCTYNTTYPLLGGSHPGRTQIRKYHFGAGTVAGVGWGTYSGSGGGIPGPGTTTTGYFALPALMHGAVLTTLKVYFTPSTAVRASWTLGTNITAALQYRAPVAGVASTVLTSGSASTYAPVSQADYQNGLVKSLTIACGAPTIDVGTNIYFLALTDESGAGAVSGNVFHCVEATYTISDLSVR